MRIFWHAATDFILTNHFVLTQLDDKPIQHREVMGYESSLFQSYFKAITLLEGG